MYIYNKIGHCSYPSCSITRAYQMESRLGNGFIQLLSFECLRLDMLVGCVIPNF